MEKTSDDQMIKNGLKITQEQEETKRLENQQRHERKMRILNWIRNVGVVVLVVVVVGALLYLILMMKEHQDRIAQENQVLEAQAKEEERVRVEEVQKILVREREELKLKRDSAFAECIVSLGREKCILLGQRDLARCYHLALHSKDYGETLYNCALEALPETRPWEPSEQH